MGIMKTGGMIGRFRSPPVSHYLHVILYRFDSGRQNKLGSSQEFNDSGCNSFTCKLFNSRLWRGFKSGERDGQETETLRPRPIQCPG
jgi:hypothetical protein